MAISDIYTASWCMESREYGGHRIAVKHIEGGRAKISVSPLNSYEGEQCIAAAWYYDSPSQALAAWFAWDPANQPEPQGYISKTGGVQ